MDQDILAEDRHILCPINDHLKHVSAMIQVAYLEYRHLSYHFTCASWFINAAVNE